MGGSEYRDVIHEKGQDDLYFGTSGSLTAGRIAHVLGLEGPAMPVDMACASSLAAVHHAMAALQRGEIDMALAGGVNVTLSLPMARFHRDMGMLSASGRCNAFDTTADGFVRSEGCGVVVLKRLSQAEIDGDRIWALVKGTAINQSGASSAMPVPNGPAQERVMEEALARAGVSAAEVDYLEAHGTGTDLGDSIELRALASVYGKGRPPERPLLLGSVKTNIGHAEWASGMASIIKAVLGMNKGVIPAHLHFNEPNPNFDWEQMPVHITSRQMAWPLKADRPPLSAVNSFGLSGANAHLVLEGRSGSSDDARPAGDPPWPSGQAQLAPLILPSRYGEAPEPFELRQARAVRLLPLSGRSPEALRDLAGAYLSWLDSADVRKGLEADPARFLADTAWTAGTGRSHFTHRAGVTFRDADDLREGLKNVLTSEKYRGGPAAATDPSIAFVYAGAAGRWAGMAKEWYRTEPGFRMVLDLCEEWLQRERGESLLDVLFSESGPSGRLSQPEWANPACFAVEIALTALLASVGIQPQAVLGRGMGEIAAAHTAGVLTLEDGLRLAAALSGPEAALPIVPAAAPTVTLVSSSAGGPVHTPRDLDNGHWRRVVAGGGDFKDEMNILAAEGASLVLAMAPASDFNDVADGMPAPVIHFPQPASDNPSGGSESFAKAVAAAYEAGAPVNFGGMFAGEERRRIAIPAYPFQRRSFWVQRRRVTS